MNVVGKLAESDKTVIRAFHGDVREAALADHHRRLAETRLPEQEAVGDYSQGVPRLGAAKTLFRRSSRGLQATAQIVTRSIATVNVASNLYSVLLAIYRN
jgi:hypothetical protein